MKASSRKRYGIFRCRKCGGFNLAQLNFKTKTCPYCGARNSLSKVKFLAYASTWRAASEAVRRLKRLNK
ncbi:DUF1922 domain-containing protein [Candidatus Bathyarchaeota archaeon]|nr:MAG: DUF1922 domain-containing protein [Candidatus Hecatellales archaeon]RLI34489.1 MAG: DUF1922 domain-containing protein [Candidatus Bathyarchaeota archaeon]